MEYRLHWSEESVRNLEEILEYLNTKWTFREVENFKRKLSKQLDLIIRNPYLFPVSTYNPRLRKAVLSRQTTIFYEIRGENLFLVYLFVNRKNIERIKEDHD